MDANALARPRPHAVALTQHHVLQATGRGEDTLDALVAGKKCALFLRRGGGAARAALDLIALRQRLRVGLGA